MCWRESRLIEKVIVGKIDENGEVDPYNITFIYKTGLDNTVNGEKYRTDGRKKDSNVLPSNSTGGVTVLPSNHISDTCGDSGKTTTPEPLILLEFKHFYDFFSFSKNCENYHQKDLKNSIKIRIAI